MPGSANAPKTKSFKSQLSLGFLVSFRFGLIMIDSLMLLKGKAVISILGGFQGVCVWFKY